MLKIRSFERPIAFVDIDGVIVENPPEAQTNVVITDKDFWSKHWNNPWGEKLNTEMCSLVKSLVQTHWHVVFLTARPESYRDVTRQLLKRAGFDTHTLQFDTSSTLIMLDETNIPSSSAEWKQTIIRDAKRQGGNVQLMIEDYKPNAEAVRAIVPVLLYERKKISNHHRMFQCCGGMSVCWCPTKEGVPEPV